MISGRVKWFSHTPKPNSKSQKRKSENARPFKRVVCEKCGLGDVTLRVKFDENNEKHYYCTKCID